MDQANAAFIKEVLDRATDLTLATIRPDGYPQATTVSFAHDGLALYAGIGRDSQKARNIRANDKVSLTINLPYEDWSQIRGLSMSAHAEILDKARDLEVAKACLLQRFPQVAAWADQGMADAIVFLKMTPQVISILDYSKGFGHTEQLSASSCQLP